MQTHPNVPNKIIHGEESYLLNGVFYRIHNNLGRFLLEKQYGDALEVELKKAGISYEREKVLKIDYTNASIPAGRVDFLIYNKILVDIKAKKFITKEDYFQMQRYLRAMQLELGLIVNFRSTYLKAKRILNSEMLN